MYNIASSSPNRATDKSEPPDLTGQVFKTGDYPFASGGFADVWRGKWEWEPTEEKKTVTQEVAIKVIRAFSGITKHKLQTRMKRELIIWSGLLHDHIIPLYGVVKNFGLFDSLVSPYMKNGNASKFLEGQDIQGTMSARYKLLCEIASGLQYLHNFSPTIIHGDLKATNILIDDNGSAMLSDFGLSTLIGNVIGSTRFTTTTSAGSRRWMAPELLLSEDEIPKLTMASDVWAYACTTIEMMTGKIPYSDLRSDANHIMAVMNGTRPARETEFSKELWTLLQKCWREDPAKRPSISLVKDIMDDLLLASMTMDHYARDVPNEKDAAQCSEGASSQSSPVTSETRSLPRSGTAEGSTDASRPRINREFRFSMPLTADEIPSTMDILKEVIGSAEPSTPSTPVGWHRRRPADLPPPVPYVKKVEFGEKEISLDQTRRIVLQVLGETSGWLGKAIRRPLQRVDKVKSEYFTLDLLFVQDATASQGPYIDSAKDSILEICHLLKASKRLREEEGLQIGLLAYRDYDQEHQEEFLTKSYGFTYDLDKMKSNLSELTPAGGGDGPEALGAALDGALNMDGWREESIKVVVVITDAPPHGLGERSDAFPNGAPDGFDNHDPIALAREMLESGMVLLVMACEPSLSEYYYYATDFYKAITRIAAGAMYPLADPKLLSAYIIGSVLEGVELQEKTIQYQENLARRFFVDKEPIDKIVKDLHAELRDAQQKVTTVAAPIIHQSYPEAEYNVKTFSSSATLAEARSKGLKRVRGKRFTPGFTESRMSTSASLEEFSSLKITVKNTGANCIIMKTYDSDEQKLYERVIMNNLTYILDFFINRPYNFILERGRTSRTFSRTFTNAEQELDLEILFSLS